MGKSKKNHDDMPSGTTAVIDALEETIQLRHEQFLALEKAGDGKAGKKSPSRTVQLFASGTHKIAQKVGEEAVETVIESGRERRRALVEESVDLLFHLMVLWRAHDIDASSVWGEMAKRHGLPEDLERKGRVDAQS